MSNDYNPLADLGCLNHIGDPSENCYCCYNVLLDVSRELESEVLRLRDYVTQATKERDSLVSEYERAVRCDPQGYLHAYLHIYNAITNAQIDANSDTIVKLLEENEALRKEKKKTIVRAWRAACAWQVGDHADFDQVNLDLDGYLKKVLGDG